VGGTLDRPAVWDRRGGEATARRAGERRWRWTARVRRLGIKKELLGGREGGVAAAAMRATRPAVAAQTDRWARKRVDQRGFGDLG